MAVPPHDAGDKVRRGGDGGDDEDDGEDKEELWWEMRYRQLGNWVAGAWR